MNHTVKSVALASLFWACGVCTSLAASYSFTKIVDSGSGYFLSQTGGGSPQINNSGTVVFTAHTQLPTGGFTILTGNGGPLTFIDGEMHSPTQSSFVWQYGASINDAGVVAYQRTTNYATNTAQGIYTSAGTTIYESTTSVSNNPPFVSTYGTPSINNSDRVAFVAYHQGGSWLATGDGGPLTVIADIPGADGQVNPINQGALNDSGSVAFSAWHWTPGTSFSLYSGSGGPLTTIYSGLDVYEQQPDINNAGTVTFSHGQPLVVTGNGGPLTPVPSGAVSLSVDPSINNLGQIAFLGEDFSNVVGIYLGASLNPLVKRGDSLDGSTIQYFVGGPSLNDHGQIAFSVGLADGREGIWVANPVPEPSSLVLAALGFVGLAASRWRRRR